MLSNGLLAVDLTISQAAARLTGHSALFDGVVKYLIQYQTFKIFPLVALLCAAASLQPDRVRAARLIAQGVGAGLVALLITRLIQNFSPPRPRPGFVPGFDAPAPFIVPDMQEWSSFPSDTSALAMALAVVVLTRSRPLGALALAWTVIIALARLIGALHYSSDILAGAMMGAVAGLAFSTRWVGHPLRDLTSRCLHASPALTSLLLVALLFQVATMFEDVRMAANGMLRRSGIVRPAAVDVTYPSAGSLPVPTAMAETK